MFDITIISMFSELYIFLNALRYFKMKQVEKADFGKPGTSGACMFCLATFEINMVLK